MNRLATSKIKFCAALLAECEEVIQFILHKHFYGICEKPHRNTMSACFFFRISIGTGSLMLTLSLCTRRTISEERFQCSNYNLRQMASGKLTTLLEIA